MSVKGVRKSWPAKPPRKGTKAREALIRYLKGATAKELNDLYDPSALSAWMYSMFNEKGIEVRSVNRTFLLVGFMRTNGRYRQAPGSLARIERLKEKTAHV